MKRNRVIQVRATEQEKAEFRRGAVAAGFMTRKGKPDVSAYVRWLGQEQHSPPTDPRPLSKRPEAVCLECGFLTGSEEHDARCKALG